MQHMPQAMQHVHTVLQKNKHAGIFQSSQFNFPPMTITSTMPEMQVPMMIGRTLRLDGNSETSETCRRRSYRIT